MQRHRSQKEYSGSLLVSRLLGVHPPAEEDHGNDGSVAPYSARKTSRPALSPHDHGSLNGAALLVYALRDSELSHVELDQHLLAFAKKSISYETIEREKDPVEHL